MVENQLSEDEAKSVWNEEAQKLDAGNTPAIEAVSAAPETPQGGAPEPEVELVTEPEQKVDPLAALPEEVRIALGKITQLEEANAQLLHHVKTAEGRVAAMQSEFQRSRQAAAVASDAPTQGQMAAAVKNPEKWEQLKGDFPEWASAMEEYVGAKLSGIPSNGIQATQVVDYVQAQMAQGREQMRAAIEEARVEGKYEDWRDTVKTPDFTQWLAIQPNEVRALADSPAARDAIRMLDMFHSVRTKPASEIKQERGARLAAAATTRPGQTPPPKTMGDLSAKEQWDYEAKIREQELARRGY